MGDRGDALIMAHMLRHRWLVPPEHAHHPGAGAGVLPAEGFAPPACVPGLHEQVASFDFSAFYPAIVAGGGIRGFP